MPGGSANLANEANRALPEDDLPSFPFLKLPPELRRDVYNCVLTRDKQPLHLTKRTRAAGETYSIIHSSYPFSAVSWKLASLSSSHLTPSVNISTKSVLTSSPNKLPTQILPRSQHQPRHDPPQFSRPDHHPAIPRPPPYPSHFFIRPLIVQQLPHQIRIHSSRPDGYSRYIRFFL